MPDDVLRLRTTVVNDQALANIRALGREIGMIGRTAQPGIRAVNAEFVTLSATIKSIGRGISEVIPGVGGIGLGAAGAAIGIGTMVRTLNDAARRVNELHHASRELGMSERDIRAWSSAGEKVGVTTQQMQQALHGFRQTTDGLRFNIGGARDALYSMGAGPLASRLMNLRDPLERMRELLRFRDTVISQPNGLIKAEQLFNALGVPLSMLRVRLEDFNEAQQRLTRRTPEQEAAARKYAASLVTLGEAWSNLVVKTGARLFPMLQQDIEDLEKLADLLDPEKLPERLRRFERWFRGENRRNTGRVTTPPVAPEEPSAPQARPEGAPWWWTPGRNRGGAPPQWTPIPRGGGRPAGRASPISFGGFEDVGGGGEAGEASRIVQTGVFDALVQFQSYVAGGAGGGGGGGGIQRAAFSPGGGMGTGPGTGGYSGGGWQIDRPSTSPSGGAPPPSAAPSGGGGFQMPPAMTSPGGVPFIGPSGAPAPGGGGAAPAGGGAAPRGAVAPAGGRAGIPGYPAGVNQATVEAHIRQSALARGVDPDTAIRVFRAEGGSSWQSTVRGPRGREQSWGPFQLFTGGGEGNRFQRQTGLDPRNPETWRQNVDFAMNRVVQGGWGPWAGARRHGITGMRGVGPGASVQPLTPFEQGGGAPAGGAPAFGGGAVPSWAQNLPGMPQGGGGGGGWPQSAGRAAPQGAAGASPERAVPEGQGPSQGGVTVINRRDGRSTITTSSGARFNVASQYAPNFAGFLRDYEAAGGTVSPQHAGSWNVRNIAGTNRPSLHSFGRAIDINITGRNRFAPGWGGLPGGVRQEEELARRHGLSPGSAWRNPDRGHFEVADPATALRAQQRHPFLGAAPTARLDQSNAPTNVQGNVNVTVNSNGTAARTTAQAEGSLWQQTTVHNYRQMQPTEWPAAPVPVAN